MLDDANDLPARNIEAIFSGVEARKNHCVLLSLGKLYQSRSYHNESSAVDWLQSTDHQLAVLMQYLTKVNFLFMSIKPSLVDTNGLT
jgi:hypothetical protein